MHLYNGAYNHKEECQQKYHNADYRTHGNLTSGKRGIEKNHGTEHERENAPDSKQAKTLHFQLKYEQHDRKDYQGEPRNIYREYPHCHKKNE